MKKLAKILGFIIVFLIIIIVTLPIIFKDDVKVAIDEAIAENINANVYYDPDGFNLSLVPNFPNFTFGMSDFGISGIGTFEGDTLLNVGSFEFVIDVMSVINGEVIGINAIILNEPDIYIKVLADGQANYDIAMPTEELDLPEEEVIIDTTEATAFSISIDKWQIKDGNLVYDDQSMNVYAAIKELNHTGSGDFTQDIFDLTTTTSVQSLTTSFEGVSYLKNRTLDMDITLNMDLPNAKYTFKENFIKLNALALGIDGYVAMPGEDISMDLAIGGKDISLAGLLSLIPGVYQEYLDGLETDGDIDLSAKISGVYNEKSLPTVIASLDIKDGYIKYADYPIPMEQINISTVLNVPGENMDAMTFDMPVFSMLLDGEEMAANLHFENLQNYTWDFGFNGNLDLEKVMKIMAIDTLELRGKINANLKTSGNMALVDAEKYDQIPAKGDMTIKDFYFKSTDLPQGFGIVSSKLTFSPRRIALKEFDATLGKSDMQLTGSLSNFIAYALNDDEVLKGNLDFNSNTFDLNEWMTEEEEVTEEVVEDTTTLEVVRLPTNIHFVLESKLRSILYDSMVIDDMDGLITIKNGVAKLNNIDFHMLDGDFEMNGQYNSVPDHPLYDFAFAINHLSIPAAFKTFNSVEKMAPAAKNMKGKFSANFDIAGSLDEGMMPNYEDMNGEGMLVLEKASLEGEKIMTAVSKLTKSENSTLDLDDIKITFQIVNGRIYVDPFDVNYGGYAATIAGSNGFDGSIDYIISTEVPTGAAGDAINSLVASYTGGNSIVGETIPVNLNIKGTYDDPKVGLVGSSSGSSATSSATDAAKAAAKAEFDKQKKIAEQKAKAEIDKQKKRAKAELDKQKKIAEQKAKAEIAKQKKIAEDKVKAEIAKQKKIAEEKAKKEAEEKAKKEAENALNSLFKKKN